MKFKISKIQASLDLSVNKFIQLHKLLKQEINNKVFTISIFGTNKIRWSIQDMVDKLISKFGKRFVLANSNFVCNVIS